MSVKFLLCTDFEATCFSMGEPNWFQEIIEFAVVLINLETGHVEREFHRFVRPTEFSRLSPGCIKKLQIPQSTVDRAQPLSFVLNEYVQWLNVVIRDLNVEMPISARLSQVNNNMVICTWSPADLNIFLRNECIKKRINVPVQLKCYVDAQEVARIFRVRLNLEEAMSDMGIPFQGRLHSGIDDAKNLARLVYTMYRRNARFDAIHMVDV